MDTALYVIAIVAFVARLLTIPISKRHEQALLKAGAVEHGSANTKLLTVVHLALYLAAIVEGALRQTQFDGLSLTGLGIYVFGMAMLVWVIRLLGPIWTVKIMIAPQHTVVRHPLFRLVRHPNYFLNILPELIGFAVIFHAWYTLLIGLPLYLVPLVTRIVQEERAMRGIL